MVSLREINNSIKYWPIKRRQFLLATARFLLHAIAVSAVVGLIWLPIEYPQSFTFSSTTKYLVFYNQDGLVPNWPLIGAFILASIGTGDYFLLNIKRFLEPKQKDFTKIVEETSSIHLSTNMLCIRAVNAYKRATDDGFLDESDLKIVRQTIKRSIIKVLNTIDKVIYSHMDTVQEEDTVTSNIMIVLEPDKFEGRAWKRIEKKLEQEAIYPQHSCSLEDCSAWLRLELQSRNSHEELSLPKLAVRVNKNPRLSIPGGGVAYHKGLRFIENNEERLHIAAVNDVEQITWPEGVSRDMQTTADDHFQSYAQIKSFISIPLVHLDQVVGILNINSSNYYLGGFYSSQRSVLRNAVLPILTQLSELIHAWRSINYDITEEVT